MERLDELEMMMEFRYERLDQLKAELTQARQIVEKHPRTIERINVQLELLEKEYTELRAKEKGSQATA